MLLMIDLIFDVKFNKMLSKQMYSSTYYGVVIYSKDLQDLENNWEKTKRVGLIFIGILTTRAREKIIIEMRITIVFSRPLCLRKLLD